VGSGKHTNLNATDVRSRSNGHDNGVAIEQFLL
jgi:hypothetical protein